MKINFSARHFDATDKLREFTSEEIRRLKKYFDGILHADVVLEENGANKSAEIRVNMLGKVMKSRAEDTDFYKMIPKLVDKIESQVKTKKAKAFAKQGKTSE